MIKVSTYQVLKLDGVTIDDVKFCDLLEEHYVEHNGTNYEVDKYSLPQTNAFSFTVVLVESSGASNYGTGVIRSIKAI
jgi:hypothetical protein